MPEKYSTIDEYINAHPPLTRKKLEELRSCILKAAPDATELFNYGIPAFALQEGGKRDKQIMIAGYGRHVGLYPHPVTIEYFKDELVQYKQGKGSVQFPLDRELPEDLIIRMVKFRYDMIKNSKHEKK